MIRVFSYRSRYWVMLSAAGLALTACSGSAVYIPEGAYSPSESAPQSQVSKEDSVSSGADHAPQSHDASTGQSDKNGPASNAGSASTDPKQNASAQQTSARPCNTSVPDAYKCAGGPIPSNAIPLTVFDTQQNITAIVTPSGNITCDSYADFIQCRMGKRWPAGVNPIRKNGGPMENEGVDAVTLHTSGPIGAGVATDAPAGAAFQARRQELPYGTVWRHDNYVLASEEAGLTIWNADTGFGALINRDGYFPFGP